MKKRNARNYGKFSILSIAFLLITSLALAAGSNIKLSTVKKNSIEKKVIKNETQTHTKEEVKSSSQKGVTKTNVVKDLKPQNSNSTPVKNVKKVEQKTINVKPQNNIKKYSATISNESKKVDISKIKKVSKPQQAIHKTENYNLKSETHNIPAKKLIKSSDSVVPSNIKPIKVENNKIHEYLKKNPYGSSSYQISPKPKLKAHEIEIENEDDNVEVVIYNNVEYRYYYGYYYRPWDGFYWRIWPSFGFRVPWLPPYYYAFWWNDREYYYSCNVYYVYIEDEDEYVVVRPPIGAVIETLPDYSENVIIDGETYFVADGVQYKAVLVNDEVWFKVIKVIDESEHDSVELAVGSLIEYLPEDHEVVVIDEQTYFISDKVQYKAVLVNDEIWYKVLKVG